MNIKLLLRKLWGSIACDIYPNYLWCYRCHRPWRVCSYHGTYYNDHSGCFPLCEQCWQELIPEERLPYYEKKVNHWRMESGKDHNGQSWDDLWQNLRENVLAGQ